MTGLSKVKNYRESLIYNIVDYCILNEYNIIIILSKILIIFLFSGYSTTTFEDTALDIKSDEDEDTLGLKMLFES